MKHPSSSWSLSGTVLVALAFFPLSTLQSAELPVPSTDVVPTMAAHEALIQQGIALHDAGDYAAAIKKYEEVLAENPDDVVAIYEMVFSLSAVQEWERCAKLSRTGASYRSDFTARFHMTWANCVDSGGKPKKAVQIYEAAVSRESDLALLRFNYAVTLAKLSRTERAKKELKISAMLAPAHVGSHVLLAQQFAVEGKQMPAALAALRALVLEAGTPRAAEMLRYVHQPIENAVGQGDPKDGKPTLNIFMATEDDNEEGEFASAGLVLSIFVAAKMTDDPGKPLHLTVDDLVPLLTATLESIFENNKSPKPQAFVAQYYVPFLAAAFKRGHLETLLYYVHRGVSDEADKWIDGNTTKIEDFLRWEEAFDFKSDIVVTN